MRVITSVTTLVAVLALLSVGLSHASSDYTISGVVCQAPNAITPKFGWSPDGALNKHPIDNKWAVCPVMKLNDATGLKVTVNLVNDGNTRRSVKCWLREHSQGRVIASSSGTIAINAGGFSDRMFWEGQQFSTGSSLTVQCQLPPSVIIESIRSEYLGGSDSGGSGGGNSGSASQACITSPASTAFSGDDIVEMKNGMRLNNYDGRHWSTSESHIVFKTTSGDWYTIEDAADFYRLDVIDEPESCFEPDNIESPYRVDTVGSDKRIYVVGGYVVVSDQCPITTNSLLASYQPSFSRTYVVDLKTARECLIKDVVEE